MRNLEVTSREYKIMLKASRFRGDEAKLLEEAEGFWQVFRRAIAPIVIDTSGDFDTVEKRRFIRFHDTDTLRLRANGYVFRERTDAISNEREVTLKFRHEDRYFSQDRNMSAKDDDEGETKFEEDIKPPFQKLYSYSTKQPISSTRKLNRMNDPGRLYPGLRKRLDHYDKDEALHVVGKDEGFTAKELVITGAEFRIGNKGQDKTECALVAWYKADGDLKRPVLVEMSFRYGDDHEKYKGRKVKRAYDAFMQLQALNDWVSPRSKTKTAYVFSLETT